MNSFVFYSDIIGRAMTVFHHPRRPLNMTIYQKKKNVYKHFNRDERSLCLHFVGEEWACLQKLFKGIYY